MALRLRCLAPRTAGISWSLSCGPRVGHRIFPSLGTPSGATPTNLKSYVGAYDWFLIPTATPTVQEDLRFQCTPISQQRMGRMTAMDRFSGPSSHCTHPQTLSHT